MIPHSQNSQASGRRPITSQQSSQPQKSQNIDNIKKQDTNTCLGLALNTQCQFTIKFQFSF